MRAPVVLGLLAVAAGAVIWGAGHPDRLGRLLGLKTELADPLARLPEWMVPPKVPADNPMTSAKVDLGRHLFYDARLSQDGTVACATCHQQAHAFADTTARSVGVHGTEGRLNAPSIANAAYMTTLMQENPDIDTLERQMLIPLFGDDPVEMGSGGQEDAIAERLEADPYYPAAFSRAFPQRDGAIDLFTITRAIAAFERSILSFDAPYDRYKKQGQEDAISAAAKRGEQLFFDHRFECYHCHQGPTFTENLATAYTRMPQTMFHNTGLYNLGGTGAYPAGQHGLSDFTGNAGDMGRFRTPALRNVALTGPWMHDGSVSSLREVLEIYARGGRRVEGGETAGDGAQSPYRDGLIVGFDASDAEIDDLLAFLESLSDESLTTDPALSDPWPAGSPARKDRRDTPG